MYWCVTPLVRHDICCTCLCMVGYINICLLINIYGVQFTLSNCCGCRGLGITILVLSWICTLYTAWQMIEMHESVSGKRFDKYHELSQHAFGERLGLWIVVPQQLMVEVGIDIVYMVIGAKSLKKLHEILCDDCEPIKTTYFIVLFAFVQYVLSHLPSFNSVAGISLVAAAMSLR